MKDNFLFYTRFKVKFCEIILIGDENGLQNLYLNTKFRKEKIVLSKKYIKNDLFFLSVKKQINDYFGGFLKKFDIKINPQGSEFQKKVWNELRNITYGKLVSYQYIAEKIGNKNASRAVGMANNKNPLPLIIPCHRVIGKDGKLTGFSAGIQLKKNLIELERSNFY
jgi:methylated-DNA-[protein]-cysteine S-methyltransferase